MIHAVISAGFEQRVRDLAYALWESQGRPHGHDVDHWRLSEQAALAEIALAAPAPKAAKPKSAPRKKAAALRAAASTGMPAHA